MSKGIYSVRPNFEKTPGGKNFANHMRSIGAGHFYSAESKSKRRHNDKKFSGSAYGRALAKAAYRKSVRKQEMSDEDYYNATH